MAPLTSQSDDSWLSYSHEYSGGSQTKSDKISQYFVFILLISVEKLMKCMGERRDECVIVSKMMAILSLLLYDPSACSRDLLSPESSDCDLVVSLYRRRNMLSKMTLYILQIGIG